MTRASCKGRRLATGKSLPAVIGRAGMPRGLKKGWSSREVTVLRAVALPGQRAEIGGAEVPGRRRWQTNLGIACKKVLIALISDDLYHRRKILQGQQFADSGKFAAR